MVTKINRSYLFYRKGKTLNKQVQLWNLLKSNVPHTHTQTLKTVKISVRFLQCGENKLYILANCLRTAKSKHTTNTDLGIKKSLSIRLPLSYILVLCVQKTSKN